MLERPSRIVSYIAFALALSVGAPASAQPRKGDKGAAEVPSAKDLYASAQKLFDKGKYADALVAFRQVYNASSSPNARLMVGHCLVALGKPGEAYEEMAETMREAAKRAESESKYAPTRDSAATQLALLETKVGKVILDISDRTGALVTLNGARVALEKLGAPIAVDPGTAVVIATRADGRTSRREQAVKAGETQRVTLTFSEPSNAGGPGPGDGARPLVTPPSGDDSSRPAGGRVAKTGGGVRVAGFVIAGLGVAGMAVFGITGSMARSKFTTLETECGGTRCTDPKYGELVDSGMTLTTVANIGLIAGAAGIAAGGLMIVLGGPTDVPQSGAASAASISVSPGGAGLQYTVTF